MTAAAGGDVPPSKSRFRADIQGLRALAVGAVILAHAGTPGLAGGFVGVDVFFVVSGFLITSLLWREAAGTGRVSLTGFYARRARRILPAATVVTLATLAAAVAVLPLVRAVEVLEDGLFAALFVANFRFAAVGTDYFAQGESPSPLQHMWSLSVEEQFYLVWPLLLIGLLWWALRRPGRSTRAVTLVVLGAVAIASLAWSAWQTHDNPEVAYFSSLTRAWELGAGALVAVAVGALPRASPWLREAASWLGLAAVLAAVVGYDAATPFPGVAAVLPVVGTVLLVLADGGERPTTVGRLLSVRPARVLGDWSYSLYLWHWPVLQIARERSGALEVWQVVLLVALVVVLSWATYTFVEQPFRARPAPSRRRVAARSWSRRGLALYPLSFALVGAAFLGGRWYVDVELAGGDAPPITAAQYRGEVSSKDPAVALVEASVAAARDDAPLPGDLVPSLVGLRDQTAPLGDCDYRTGTTQLCNLGDPDADRAIVVLGDSHARAWSPAISAIGTTYGYATYSLVLTGCPAAQVVQGDQATLRPFEACQDFKEFALDAIANLDPDLVVLSSSALGPVIDTDGTPVQKSDPDRFRAIYQAGMAAELELLRPLADRVVVLGDTPLLPREPGVCLSQRGVDLGDCLFEPGGFQHVLQNDYRNQARDQGVDFVSGMKWFCADGQCPAVVGRTITMRDREHMTPTYAVELARPLARALRITDS